MLKKLLSIILVVVLSFSDLALAISNNRLPELTEVGVASSSLFSAASHQLDEAAQEEKPDISPINNNTAAVPLGRGLGGVTVSGKVRTYKTYNSENGTTIRLVKDDKTVYETIIPGFQEIGQLEQGFTISNVMPGIYTLEATKAAHTKYKVEGVIVATVPVDLTKDPRPGVGVMALVIGDVNNNGSINSNDANLILSGLNYGKNTQEAWDKAADLNGDGAINVNDLNLVLSIENYAKGTIVISGGMQGHDFDSAVPIIIRCEIAGKINNNGDADYYSFVSSDDTTTFLVKDGAVTMELYNNQRALLHPNSYGAYQLTAGNTYYIKVYGAGAAGYSLEVMQFAGGYDQIVVGDVTITSATTHTGCKVLYTGNVTVTMVFTLRNASVDVLGTLNIDSNYIDLEGNSNLVIGKELRIQEKGDINDYDNDGYGETTGYVYPVYVGSKITVYGNFYTQSNDNRNFRNCNGMLELHGNFNQIGDTYFNASYADPSKIVFAGEEEQHVSFDAFKENAKLGKVLVANVSGRIWFNTPVYEVTLLGNTTIKGDEVEIRELNLNGYTATIDGNIVFNYYRVFGGLMQGNLIVRDCQVKVGGNIYQISI